MASPATDICSLPSTDMCSLPSATYAQIPELVAITMGFLRGDGSSLVNCATVNKMWAQEATNVIWEWLPTWKTCFVTTARAWTGLSVSGGKVSFEFCPILLDMPRERLEWYAKKVRRISYLGEDSPSQRKVDLENKTTMHQQLAGVAFPRLRSLELHSADLADSLIVPYLQADLQYLSLSERPCSDFVLEQLEEKCPILEELVLDDPGSLTAGALLKFLQECTSLTRLRCRSYMQDVCTSAVFCHLANRSTLTCLEFASCITESMTLAASSANTDSFSSLQVLECQVDAQAVESLLSQLPNLVDISLAVKGHGRHLLGHVAQSTKLQFIEIVFEFDIFLDQHDIIKLADNCQAVQSLQLVSENRHPSLTPTAETFQKSIEEVTTRLASLTHLEILLWSPIRIDLFNIVERPRSNVDTVYLSSVILGVSELDLTKPCAFPNLLYFGLYDLDNSEVILAARFAEIIRHHAPLLKRLSILKLNVFNTTVKDLLRTGSEFTTGAYAEYVVT